MLHKPCASYAYDSIQNSLQTAAADQFEMHNMLVHVCMRVFACVGDQTHLQLYPRCWHGAQTLCRQHNNQQIAANRLLIKETCVC
jgi:hypothetical protein